MVVAVVDDVDDDDDIYLVGLILTLTKQSITTYLYQACCSHRCPWATVPRHLPWEGQAMPPKLISKMCSRCPGRERRIFSISEKHSLVFNSINHTMNNNCHLIFSYISDVLIFNF